MPKTTAVMYDVIEIKKMSGTLLNTQIAEAVREAHLATKIYHEVLDARIRQEPIPNPIGWYKLAMDAAIEWLTMLLDERDRRHIP